MLPQSFCHCDGSLISQWYQYYKLGKGINRSQYVLVTSGGLGKVSGQVNSPHLDWVTGRDRVQLALARGRSPPVIARTHVTSLTVICDVIAPTVPVQTLAHMGSCLKSPQVTCY